MDSQPLTIPGMVTHEVVVADTGYAFGLSRQAIGPGAFSVVPPRFSPIASRNSRMSFGSHPLTHAANIWALCGDHFCTSASASVVAAIRADASFTA